MLSDLEEGHAKRPDIRGDGVALACDTLRRHVVASADEGIGITACAELTTDAKVAEFHGAVAAEEDVGGFYVWGVELVRMIKRRRS